jgi:diadenosine tetraphosphatase ApaH/serine/threonine PP2A family protein phosphatase
MEILIVGSVGDEPVLAGAVHEALSSPHEINRDGQFIGKPGTRLFVTETHVLKVRNEYSMDCDQARQWCHRQVLRESSWRIYHPSRTWVVLRTEQGCAAANITRRLPTLASMLAGGGADQQPAVSWLVKLSRFYFDFVVDHGLRQDEGLTNYGIDQGLLWYLDDDIYQPDQGIGFSHSLAGFLRSLDGLDEACCQALGEELRHIVSRLGPSMADVLWHQIQDVFMPAHRDFLRAALGRGLTARSRTRRQLDLDKPVVILADIHGNAAALEAVLMDISQRGHEQLLVLGDLVGYGPDPGRCVDLIAASGALVIRGNHDQAASTGVPGQGFSRAASWSAPWTWQQLTPAQRSWLAEQPLCLRQQEVMAVHGAPRDPGFFNAYVYATTSDSNLDYMAEHGLRLCFHGHSHLPGYWYQDHAGRSGFSREAELRVSSRCRYLVCPGSVGQPRDGSRDASYLIWWPADDILRWVRVPYDLDSMLEQMRCRGFPDFVLRLFAGPVTVGGG